MSAKDVLNCIYNNSVIDSFSNAVISLRIYFSLPVTIASAERNYYKFQIQTIADAHQ